VCVCVCVSHCVCVCVCVLCVRWCDDEGVFRHKLLFHIDWCGGTEYTGPLTQLLFLY
jgi:hypothetical protein